MLSSIYQSYFYNWSMIIDAFNGVPFMGIDH
jgi:hypothetical protein